MVITVDGSKAVLKGYEHEFERKSAGRGDGAFMPEEQYGSLYGIGEAAVLNPLAFRMVGCTDGGAAKGAGAGIVSLRGAHKARSRGQEVLLERDTGSCSGMLIYPNGATISCNCAFRFTKTQSETAPVKTETATRLPAGHRGDGSKDASDKSEEKDTDKKPIIEPITITSVSWIDREKLRKELPELFNRKKEKGWPYGWPYVVMAGALATSNKAPPYKLKLDESKKPIYKKYKKTGSNKKSERLTIRKKEEGLSDDFRDLTHYTLKWNEEKWNEEGLSDDFRALIHYTLKWNEDGELEEIADKDLNPGFTPKLNKNIEEIPSWEKRKYDISISIGEEVNNFPWWEPWWEWNYPGSGPHPGEKSPLSVIKRGELPASSLKIPEGAEVLSSALIKFRMGEESNSLLTGKLVRSPFHAPWVWCEHAVILERDKVKGDQVSLLANGSHFPSHAWYVNGKKVLCKLQETVEISEYEPILSTGMPVRGKYWMLGLIRNAYYANAYYAPAGPAWPKAKYDKWPKAGMFGLKKKPVPEHDYTLKDTSPTFLRLLNLSDSFLSNLLSDSFFSNGNVTERQCTLKDTSPTQLKILLFKRERD